MDVRMEADKIVTSGASLPQENNLTIIVLRTLSLGFFILKLEPDANVFNEEPHFHPHQQGSVAKGKLTRLAKQMTPKLHREKVRKKFTKLNLFKGQKV